MEGSNAISLKILKQDNIEQAPEILVYFWIETLGDFIHCMRRAHRLHVASEEVLQDAAAAREDQECLVELLKSRKGFAFADHADYMRWYRWWNHWHKITLTEDQWRKLDRLLKWDGTQTEETYAEWRPEGDWREAQTTSVVTE